YYRLLIFLTDILAALIALQGAIWFVEALNPFMMVGSPAPTTYLFAGPAVVFGIWSMRGYELERIFRIAEEVAILLLASLVGMGIFAGLLFFTDRNVPRLVVLCFALLTPLFALLFRLSWRQLFKWRRAPRVPTARVLIVGAGMLGRQVGRQLQERAWLGLELVGYVDDCPKEGLTLGALAELEKLCVREAVDVVIVTLPLESHGQLAALLERIHDLPVQVKLLPDLYPLAYLYSRLEMFGGMPLIGLSEPVISPWQAAVKRAMDVVISIVGLILCAPLMGLIALGIRSTSPGPVIFSHERVGEGGRIFRMYKFRTMVKGAEQMLLEEAEHDETLLVKQADDPRVTPFGRWLRRFSLDELPNLWNVLKGDMSIVGPRPEVPYLVERYEPWQRKRLLVPQGITGWWQINGRSDKPMLYHTEDDMYYIRNFSLLLDLEILWKTVWVVVRGKGAY
ncbi:MAG: sugar transferase, partial [Chloroflexota bacterium]|nr:sugar transferase [Chloroflexota bacterium]